jgi:uncharacterized protein
MTLAEKYQRLQQLLSEFDSVVVAFSGGVDSTLLLKVACDQLGPDRVLALTASSPIFSRYELEQSGELAQLFGVQQRLISSDEMALEHFVENGPRRCYYCKHSLFSRFLWEAKKISGTLVDGSNLDDLDDYRPGREALEQLQLRSPLLEVGLGKAEIRRLSRQLGLPTWDKQPSTCLATRFPYGTGITVERLQQIDQCETWLRLQGFSCYRVRYHDQLARIEVAEEDIPRLVEEPLRQALLKEFKLNGFDYIALDLQGYRSGSMNEVLSDSGSAEADQRD